MRHESASQSAAPAVPAGERNKVVSLWHERARRLGLTEGQRPDFGAVGRGELARLVEQHHALYRHALPVMEMLHQQILNTHSMVILTDQRGTIVHSLGDADFLQKAERVALKPGVLWSEDSKGTNAIGTALAERRATLVHGGEHFLAVNRFLTCSCSPIRDPRGEVIGALDVSGPQESYHAHTLALVRMSTRMIENHLFVDHFGEALRIHFHSRRELMGTLLECIAAFDEAGRFLAANPSGLTQLGIETHGAQPHTLSSLFGLDAGALLGGCRSEQQLLRLQLRDGTPVVARIDFRAQPGERAWAAGAAACAAQLAQGAGEAAAGAAQAPHGAQALPAAQAPRAAQASRAAQGGPALADLDSGDPVVADVIAKVRKVQSHDIPLLILGETGTGKEVLAQAVHNESARRQQPFVVVDCASLPESLIEAELFGYEEGAFTGARRRGNPGKILLANGGTLFLDEIGDMPLALQTRLLRVLQERAVRPLGGHKPIAVDIAVICATHRDLKDMMRRGQFREDLYYRLNGLAVRLPPLRQRRDLEALIRRILASQGEAACGLTLTAEVLGLFRGYGWPGNIRQLANVLRTASVMAGGARSIGKAQLPEDLIEELGEPGPRASIQAPLEASACQARLKDLRAAAVAAMLQRNGGNVSAAARSLGVSRNTVYRTLKASSGAADQMPAGSNR